MNVANDILPVFVISSLTMRRQMRFILFLLTLAKGRHVSRGRDEDEDEDDNDKEDQKKGENRISCIRQV